jgi:hypothetical protein
MMKPIPTPVALALASAALLGCGDQESDSTMTAMAELLPERVADWTRGEPVAYDRETIFDYIDGAGEVYRSFAFSQVQVAVYTRPDAPDITVELFDMGNPADAYGVFSYTREREESGLGGGYERKGRVLCFWQDRYYVCVASEERTEDSDRAVMESERFFHLHQSLNYHYYLARENILNLGPEADAMLARYAPGSTYLLVVDYGSEGDAAAAASSFKQAYLPDSDDSETVRTENGKFTSYEQRDRYVVVVLDAESLAAAKDLRQAAVNRLTQPRQ